MQFLRVDEIYPLALGGIIGVEISIYYFKKQLKKALWLQVN